MTEIRDVDNKWSLLTTFDPPLQKGLQLIVAPKALSRDAGTLCRLVDWQYRIANKEGAETELTVDLELIVEEIHPGLWESWFRELVPRYAGACTYARRRRDLHSRSSGATFVARSTGSGMDLRRSAAHIPARYGAFAIVALFMFVLPAEIGGSIRGSLSSDLSLLLFLS